MTNSNPLGIPPHNFRPKFKNQLYDALVKAVGDERIHDYTFSEPARNGSGHTEVRITHIPTASYFRVFWSGAFDVDSPLQSEYSPDSSHLKKAMHMGWTHTLAQVPRWINAIQEELTTEDRWANAVAIERITPTIVSDYDTDFTEPEVEQIGRSFQAAVNEIHVRRLLTPEQLVELTQVMQQRQIAAKTSGRIQWTMESARVIAHHLIEKGVDKVTAQGVMNIISQAFNWLSTHIGDAAQTVIKLLTDGS